MGIYLLGQPITLSVEIKNAAGVLTDPTDLTLKVQRRPAGTVTTIAMGSLTHDGTGRWSYVYTPPSSGNYGFSWTSTGVAAGYTQAAFQVNPHEGGL